MKSIIPWLVAALFLLVIGGQIIVKANNGSLALFGVLVCAAGLGLLVRVANKLGAR